MTPALLLLALMAPPLSFNHLPLGSVARVLSARYHVSITIIGQATAPVSGDFSHLDLRQSLDTAAKQAGLAVRPEGTGFVLGPPVAAIPVAVQPPPAPSGNFAQQRAALLKRRAALFEEFKSENRENPAKLGVP